PDRSAPLGARRADWLGGGCRRHTLWRAPRRRPRPSAGPTPAPDAAVRRVASIRAVEDVRPARLALRLDDLVAAVKRPDEDHPDVRAAGECVHHAGGRLRNRVVRGTVAVSERRRVVRSVDVAKRTPVVTAVTPRVRRLAPCLERQARAVAAFAVRPDFLRRVGWV